MIKDWRLAGREEAAGVEGARVNGPARCLKNATPRDVYRRQCWCLFAIGILIMGCLEPVAQAPCARVVGEANLFSHYLSSGPMPRTSAGVWLMRFNALVPDLTAEVVTTGPMEVHPPGSSFGFVGFWLRPDAVRYFYVRSTPGRPTELRSVDFPGATFETRGLSRLLASFPGDFAQGRLASTEHEASVCLGDSGRTATLVKLGADGGVTTTPAPFNSCVDARATPDGPAYLTQWNPQQGLALFVGSQLRGVPITASVQYCRFARSDSIDLVCLGSDPTQLMRITDAAGGSGHAAVESNDAGWVLIGAVPDLDDVFLVRDAAAEADGYVNVWALVHGAAPRRLARLFVSEDYPPLYGGSASGNLIVGSRTDGGATRFVEYCLQ
ncbi:MAG: hypothetical protein Q8L48_23625 [Archangium sp.]|nr:hypothetical protein [Archangium sp.]